MSRASEPLEPHQRTSVLHGKFAAYLPWSQPFIHALVQGLSAHCTNTVLCNRGENLDRFGGVCLLRARTRDLMTPHRALLIAAHLRRTVAPDLVHAHFGWSGIRLLLVAHLLRIPLVVSMGGRDVTVQMHDPLLSPLYDMLLGGADAIVCVSSDLRQRLIKAGIHRQRLHVIRRGVDVARFQFASRSRHPDRPVRGLMVGRLVEKKGHRYALEALAALRGESLPVQLVIVGEGAQATRLRAYARDLGLTDTVEFLAPMPQTALREEMARSDFFIHCSVTADDGDAEGIPNALVEAAATGLPAVGTRHGGIPDVVEHGVTGLLVEERDVGALAAALRTLVTQPETARGMGAAARRHVERSFDAARHVQRHVELYERLVRRPVPACRRLVRPDFVAAAHRSFGAVDQRSVSELFRELVPHRGAVRPEAWLLESRIAHLYALRHRLPEPARLPLRRLALGTLELLFALRAATLDRATRRTLQRIDDALVRSVEDGRALQLLERDWSSLDELVEHAPQLLGLAPVRPEGSPA